MGKTAAKSDLEEDRIIDGPAPKNCSVSTTHHPRTIYLLETAYNSIPTKLGLYLAKWTSQLVDSHSYCAGGWLHDGWFCSSDP
jgi:hypothetical protein